MTAASAELADLEIEGLRIPHDPAIISDQVANAIRAGRYERDEVQGTPRFLTPQDRVIELGAGIGFISSYITARLGVRNVLSIEANPDLCDFIGRVHARNGITGVEVRNCVALNDGQTPGEMPFYIRDPFWSSSMDADEAYVRRVDVPAHPLAAIIRDFRANVLIVDIEGGERDLFDPLDLSGIDKVFMEIHTRKIGMLGVKRCFDALSARNFCYDQKVSRGGAVLFRRIPARQLARG